MRIKNFFFIIIALLFSACGANDAIEPRLAEEGEILSREHFLYDINHLEYILANNFGLLDVAYWHHGVDLMTVINDMRAKILSADSNFNEHDFTDLFFVFFENSDGFLESSATNLGLYALNPSPRIVLPFAHFSVSSFNEHVDVRAITQPDETNFSLEFISMFHGREELFDEFLHYYFIAPCKMSFTKRFFAQHFSDIFELTDVMIIEDDKIGYLSIKAFPRFDEMFYGLLDDDIRKISSFLDEIRHFEHLIIDLRGNVGGDISYFADNVIRPLINEPKQATAFYFTPHGELTRLFTGNAGGFINRNFSHPTAITPVDRGLRPTSEILEQNYMTEIRSSDFERLPYGFQAQMYLEPSFEHHFDGKIWMLVDERMGSAAQIAAWFAKESGFATLVGNVTGGHYGGPRTSLSLPNTGIRITFDMLYATDSNGRPLEAGTVPHYFNFPDHDALETVLILISELKP